MSKKPGQPDSALEITAGRKTLLSAFANGVADTSAQSLAANWLRDLYYHHGIPQRALEDYEFYQRLMQGSVTDSQGQEIILTWIHDLLDGTMSRDEKETQVTEDELIAQGMRDTLPANSMQVGGDHYSIRPVQHWDFVTSHDYGYLEGQITKYLFRWRDKNGVQDLQKAAHFLQKLCEIADSDAAPINLQAFLDVNDIPEDERSIFVALHAYHGTLDPTFLVYAQDAMRRLLARATP